MVNCDVKIKVKDPNTNKDLEEALSDMIAYQLANKKVEEVEENT